MFIFEVELICVVWENILGSTLYKWKEGKEEIVELPIDEVLKGKKVVAIYFSASW
jgi:hypothetical protein